MGGVTIIGSHDAFKKAVRRPAALDGSDVPDRLGHALGL